jgi:indole-3-glycerol phosphate synthase
MGVLEEILRAKREELREKKGSSALRELRERARDAEPVRGFGDAIRRGDGPLRLIAEVKRASPSRGIIREAFNLPEILDIYERKNVDAISILTDERYFGGSIEHLRTARARTTRPLLRKDFIIDECQVYEARAYGADAILLIVSALERSQLMDLMGLAGEIGLDCLVEVHNLKELDTALYCNAGIIGINNRDLNTLDVDLNTTLDLIKDIPEGKITVSESGIESRTDVERIGSAGIDAILVGTSLMKAGDIGERIDELMGRKG